MIWLACLAGICFIALALLPSDTTAIRLSAFGWFIFSLVDFTYLQWVGRMGGWPYVTNAPYKVHASVLMWLWILLRSVAALIALRASVFWRRRALPGRLALRWLWASIRLTGVLIAAASFNWSEVWMNYPAWVADQGIPRIIAGTITLLFSLLITAAVRRRIQGLFGGFGRGARDASAATVVSCMVGGDPVEAMRSAEERLRCIRISILKAEDMANSQDSGLYSKVEPVKLGGVDAFLSHSWRDDAALKWQRMLEFKSSFEASHNGDEPLCWLDKACIDQSGDIDKSLKALPIFLLSSKSFVVFAGRTYTRRLWCVLEMFTFLRSGGSYDTIDVRPLDLDAEEEVSLFDIRRADCFVRADKHALLAIVESSYGSFSQFNAACRKILMNKLGSGGKGELKEGMARRESRQAV